MAPSVSNNDKMKEVGDGSERIKQWCEEARAYILTDTEYKEEYLVTAPKYDENYWVAAYIQRKPNESSRRTLVPHQR